MNTVFKRFLRFTLFLIAISAFGNQAYAALQMHLSLGGNLTDISGNGNNGSFPGGNGNPTFTAAIYDQGLNFDGSNDFITIPTFNPGSTFSVSLWVNHDNIGALNTFIEHAQNGNHHNDFYIGYDNNQNSLTVELEDNNATEGGACGDPKFCTGIILSDNRWYHIVVTVTPTTLDVYIDAALAYSTTHSTTVNWATGSWLIGGDTDSNPVTSANNDYLNGRMDDIRVYNHQLSQAEITALYGLVGEWKADDCSIANPNDIVDSSGNNLHASPMNGIVTAPGRICTALSLDGTDDYAEVADNAALDFSQQFTVMTWIRPESIPASGLMSILSKDENYEFHITSTGNINWWWNNSSGATREFDSTTTISTGVWTHVAIVYEAGSQRIVINGIERGTRNYNETLETTTDPLHIGGDQLYAGRYFDGFIDEVKIFRRALPTDEILGYVNNPDPLNRTCPTCGGTPTVCPSDYGVYAQGNIDLSGNIAINGNTVNNYIGSTNDAIDPTTGTLIDITPAPTLPDINPPAFVASGSTQDLNTAPAVLAAADYDYVRVRSTTTFTGGTYHIRRLRVDNNDTIILNSGDYFFDVLDMRNGSNLVIPAGQQVNLYIGTDLLTGTGVDLNAGGDAGNLNINLYSGADFELDNNGSLSGIVYSPFANSFADFDAGASLTGAVITNGGIDMDDNTTITFGANEQAAAAGVVPCTAGPDHIEIQHDGIALNCQAENVTFRACADAACSSLYTGDVVVDLLPTGWVGGDQVTITNGSSSFDLQVLTAGVYSLQATNPSPITSNPFSCVNTAVPNTSCNIEFFPSGLVFDVPAQTSCATSANVTVQALGTNPANPAQCVPLFTGNRTLKAWISYVNPVAGDQVGTPQATFNAIGSTILPTTLPGADNVTLNFDGFGRANFTVSYPDAGQLGLNMRFDGTGPQAGLSLLGSDTFVTVPFKLMIDTLDANNDCASNNTSCSAFRRTGNTADPLNEFDLRVRAACQDDTITPNFRLNNIALTSNLVAPAGGNNATLGINNFNMIKADNGVHTIVNQTVSEVGVFSFTATPATNSYLGETAPAATSAGIGRFYPAYFETAAVNSCSIGTPFTYSGQPFSVDIVTYNSNDVITANYRNGFVNSPQLSNAGVTANFTNNVFGSTHFASAPFGSGQRTDVLYTFPSKDTGETDLVIRAIDNDNVSSFNHTEGGIKIRSGRAVLDNAYGPEQSPLILPLRFEYYSAAGSGGFITNSDDSCSLYDAPATIAADRFANYTQNLNPGETTVTSGTGSAVGGLHDPANLIDLSAPGDGNYGGVHFILNNIDDWLKYNWNFDCDNADADNDISTGIDAGLCGPYGTATFGLYRGDDRIIFQREVLP